MTIVRQATRADLPAMVDAHIAAFPGFTLTVLGKKFLTLMYDGFAQVAGGVALVASEEGPAHTSLAGLAVGTADPGTFFSRLRRGRALAFAMAAAPALLRHPRLVAERLLAALRYSGDSMPDLSGYWLLSSLAVEPGHANRGIGSSLLNEFCGLARGAGARGVYLTTDAANNDGVRAFYLRSQFKVVAELKRTGGRRMLVLTREFAS